MQTTVIRVTRPRTQDEKKNGFAVRAERFLSLNEFDYRKKWYKIDGCRWTNRGLTVGETT